MADKTDSNFGSPRKTLVNAGSNTLPRRTVVDAYNKSSFSQAAPAFTFGTGVRPSLMQLDGGPGPGAYHIKSTLIPTVESTIPNAGRYTLKGREKFGDPYEKATSKTSKLEPGPGQYKLNGKFLTGENPSAISFPKAPKIPRDKTMFGPGPGSYEPLQSLGKQVLSTKPDAPAFPLPKAPRPSLVTPGATDIGPAEYNPAPAACEPQIESHKSSCSKVKFGTGFKKSSIKKPKLHEPSPGPLSYTVPGSIATKAKGSPFRNAPTAIMSGREKFGSAW